MSDSEKHDLLKNVHKPPKSFIFQNGNDMVAHVTFVYSG